MNKHNMEEDSSSKIRINKFLSDAGYCSRREADRLIQEKRVTIDGVTAGNGDRVTSGNQVCVDRIPVISKDPKVLLLFHKPPGIVCSTKKQRNEITVTEFLHFPYRIYPVGRLDKDSTGLLLLTNEGNLVNRIMKASEKHEKEYLVTVNQPVTDSFLKKMGQGVPILGQVTRPCPVEKINSFEFRIVLTQGLNRQIRRMCEYFGYKVTRLHRIRIMNLSLNGLKQGEYRSINQREWEALREQLSLDTSIQIQTGEYRSNERKEKSHKRIDSGSESGRKSLLSGRSGDHEQLRVRPSVRRTSRTGKRNRTGNGR